MASLIILIKAIIHRVEAPIGRLEDWANGISPEKLDQSLPELIYLELYGIAES